MINHLLTEEFLQITEKCGRERLALKPPITVIMMGLKIFEKELSSDEEKGGIIMFEYKKVGDRQRLLIFSKEFIGGSF